MGAVQQLPDLLEAGAAAVTALSGAITWLWVRINRMQAEVKADLELCEDARATQLIVIELLWQECKRLNPKSAVLKRGEEVLEKLKQREALRQAGKKGEAGA